jgi:tetratricopeptide (TPR) repeat protein
VLALRAARSSEMFSHASAKAIRGLLRIVPDDILAQLPKSGSRRAQIITESPATCSNASRSTASLSPAIRRIQWRTITMLSVWSATRLSRRDRRDTVSVEGSAESYDLSCEPRAVAAYTGDFATAEQEIRALPEPSAAALQALPLSLMGQGRFDDAAASYERMRTMGAFGASFGAAGLGDLELDQGRFAEAAASFERAAAEAVKAGSPDQAAMKWSALAYARLSSGHKTAAITAAQNALSSSRALAVRFLSGRILVEAGEVAMAQEIATSLAAELATEPQVYGRLIGGEIALKNGDFQQAVKILTEANSILDTWIGHFDLGRAYLEGGAYAQADTEFDRCIRRRGEALLLVDEEPTYGYFPPVYYYLGRVRDGLKASAPDMYREYLKIRGASTDDPLVPEARRRAGPQWRSFSSSAGASGSCCIRCTGPFATPFRHLPFVVDVLRSRRRPTNMRCTPQPHLSSLAGSARNSGATLAVVHVRAAPADETAGRLSWRTGHVTIRRLAT